MFVVLLSSCVMRHCIIPENFEAAFLFKSVRYIRFSKIKTQWFLDTMTVKTVRI